MKEIISVRMGQAGIQVGNSCWELYCHENDVDPDVMIPRLAMESSSASRSFNTDAENVVCFCGLNASLRTSWSEHNPGRRFYDCANYPVRSCGFFNWYDDKFTERAVKMINNLRAEIGTLRREAEIGTTTAHSNFELQEVNELEEQLKLLRENSNILEKEKMKLKTMLTFTVVGFTILFLAIFYSFIMGKLF